MTPHRKTPHRKKFSSQAEVALLQTLHDIAEAEGRQFQAVLEEAMRQYIEARQNPRAPVLTHFRTSVDRNRRLGELLAK